MTSTLFLCDTPNSANKPHSEDYVIELCQFGKRANFRFEVRDITAAILKTLDPIAWDLVNIACYIYAGDQLVTRGGAVDIYGHKWERQLNYIIPVSDPDFWTQGSIVEQLINTINFLTGDHFTFTFIETTQENRHQIPMKLPELDFRHGGADSIILFSGGADSLSAVIEQLAIYNSRPILVSHRSSPLYNARQTRLFNHLQGRYPAWHIPHISIWANLKGIRAKEFTQRSRSFLYASLAAVIGNQTGINDIILSDNGIVSVNLPKNGQVVGTYASRTTHPKYLHNFECLIQRVLRPQLNIRNTLAFKTRAEALSILKSHNCSDLLQETVSCARTRQPEVTPHCGVCSQCIDRRFGSIYANLENCDLSERYSIDIFTNDLKEGVDLEQVVSFVRFALKIERLNDDDMFIEFPELYDCILSDDPNAEQTAGLYVNLFRRFAMQVREVIINQTSKYLGRVYEASLPTHCLIRLVASGSHTREPLDILAEKVEKILGVGLPKIFQSHKPQNEHEVQDAADGLLYDNEKLLRELPLLPFGGISTKPDFSNLDNSWYYLEMKYPKDRIRLNQIVTEITSRVMIYKKQGAYAHFIIYDPNHVILDIDKLKDDIQGDRIKLSVMR